MMLTEQEAKEKWCPFSRFAIWSKHGTSAAANRLGDDRGVKVNHEYCRCIGSACMAWRWSHMPPNRRYLIRDENGRGCFETTEEPPRPDSVPASWEWVPADPDEDIPAGWLEPDQAAVARRHGYCGLAGAVEP